MKLRQVALAAEQLEPTRTLLFELLGIDHDFADPGVGEFGLDNSVMAIGDSFLEIVSPNTANTAAGRMLEKRKTTCGYMVLMQVHDYGTFAQHLQDCAARTIWSVERPEVSACHIHPKDIGGAIVSFDEMRPQESWLWAGPNWQSQRAQHVQTILGCTLQSPNADQLAARWGEIMQTEPKATDTGIRLQFEDQTFIEFVHGTDYEGISAFCFTSQDPAGAYERAAQLGLGTPDHQGNIMMGGLGLSFVQIPGDGTP